MLTTRGSSLLGRLSWSGFALEVFHLIVAIELVELLGTPAVVFWDADVGRVGRVDTEAKAEEERAGRLKRPERLLRDAHFLNRIVVRGGREMPDGGSPRLALDRWYISSTSRLSSSHESFESDSAG